jgi:hypothetical protein
MRNSTSTTWAIRNAPKISEHKLPYYPFASFTNGQLALLKVVALCFDKMVLLDPVGTSSETTVGADHYARERETMKRA